MKSIVRSLLLVLVIGASALASMGSRSVDSSCCMTGDDGTMSCVPPCPEPATCCVR